MGWFLVEQADLRILRPPHSRPRIARKIELDSQRSQVDAWRFIVIDRDAFSYQLSDLNAVCRLRLTVSFCSARNFEVLRSEFDDVSSLSLSVRTKISPELTHSASLSAPWE